MKESKQQRETRNIELVETGNLAISLNRLQRIPGDYQGRRWKRAVYHALQMTGVCDNTCAAIRAALQLP